MLFALIWSGYRSDNVLKVGFEMTTKIDPERQGRTMGIDQIPCRAEGRGPNTDVSGQGSKTEGGICRAEKIEGGSFALGD